MKIQVFSVPEDWGVPPQVLCSSRRYASSLLLLPDYFVWGVPPHCLGWFQAVRLEPSSAEGLDRTLFDRFLAHVRVFNPQNKSLTSCLSYISVHYDCLRFMWMFGQDSQKSKFTLFGI